MYYPKHCVAHHKIPCLVIRLTLLALCILFMGSLAMLSGCNLNAQRYDLARPANTMDWLLIWEDPEEVTSGVGQNPDVRVRVDDSIFGYEAPLDNYLSIYSIGLRDPYYADVEEVLSGLEAWVDSLAPARYFLPLYDDEGNLARALLIWREQPNMLMSHSFDEGYGDYLSVRAELSDYLVAQGKTVQESRVYWTWIGALVLAETEVGNYGQFFTDYAAQGSQGLPYSFYTLQGQVLSEQELVDIFEAIVASETEEASLE